MKASPSWRDPGVIAAWDRGNQFQVKLLVERIRQSENGDPLDVISLASTHRQIGLTEVARNQFALALGYFGAAASTYAFLLERYARGQNVQREFLAEAVNGFVLAAAGGEDRVIHRISAAFEAAFPNSGESELSFVRLGSILRWLCLGKSDDPLRYSEVGDWSGSDAGRLISAVVEENEENFHSAIEALVDMWKKRIRSERLHRFPDAVCDDRVLGWVKLAERAWLRMPTFDLSKAQVPTELVNTRAMAVDSMF